ncbi:LPXTG cell wall anchor domain-containing protein [Lactiplantibacillus plantarum]|uniref:pilin N-terminal domain-containing protein n=1 Tax=Lactiplantibacillus plantarum TaxID=1590 RepID=UPI0021A5FEFA|nr:pilin N-terminal domain-containing protein [Lactiplantibacillus plantarum]MCT3212795.1 LPXTG cell wall anchor domain-containing protein [Lactiplantibacillus plantarum]MCT3271872.1 LPXTG cell wall anchor domain-containing protein [Lactiplantibacillus plantarum]
MEKTITKKVLTLTSMILMTLLLVLGFNVTRVQADTNDTTTQNVVLTKYGFEKDVTAIDRATDQIWTGDGAKPLQGVDFNVYDVTANYWASPKDYKGNVAGAKMQAGTTDKQGQMVVKNLPTYVKIGDKQRHAVYLFHETNPRAGYNTSADFWLTLPAKAAADGNVYVYPKNVQKNTYERTFVKRDAETKEVLEGAGFKISNSDSKFLKLTDKDGKGVDIGEGFIDVLANNYRLTWVAESDATVFTSDKSGKFGLNGFADKTTTYTAVETNVPDGYDVAANTDFNADNSSSDILDAPSSILPHTGGTGTVIFVILGVALIAFGAVAYRKRRNGF